MKKSAIILVIAAFVANLGFSQNTSGTFQGQIAGDAPFFLHLEVADGTLTGFYKYQSDCFVVSLKGTIDQEGNFILTDNKNSYSVFEGKLQNRLVKGTFRASKKANPQPFYAVNFRGEYCNHYDCFSLVLSDRGYHLIDGNTGIDLQITTHQQDDGSIYLLYDSLNIKWYLKDSTWMIDNEQPSFIDNEGKSVSVFFDEFINGFSRIEFPEKFEDENLGITEIKLNDSYSIRLRKITQSEYIVGKWESTHLRNKPYKVITDLKEAQKMLGNKLKEIDVEEYDYSRRIVEITFNDKTKKRLDWCNLENGFFKYYPKIGILIFYGEADGDYPIDLNDSAKESEYVGDPYYHAISPDRKLRINGYSSGGASDCEQYFLEKWNPQKKKYEFAFYFLDENYLFNFCYAADWFWTSNNKALFKRNIYYREFYEIEIIEK
jgi:hypothetical protein